MHKFFILALSFVMLQTSTILYSQETLNYTHPDKLYRKGLELFEKGNFVSAQQHFKLAATKFDPKEVHQRGESEFYNALCAIELFNEDAEYLIRNFINNYPDNQKVNLAFFELGKLRYREKKYKDAIYWLTQADRGAFSKEQRSELLFKLGYSYFMVKEIARSSTWRSWASPGKRAGGCSTCWASSPPSRLPGYGARARTRTAIS